MHATAPHALLLSFFVPGISTLARPYKPAFVRICQAPPSDAVYPPSDVSPDVLSIQLDSILCHLLAFLRCIGCLSNQPTYPPAPQATAPSLLSVPLIVVRSLGDSKPTHHASPAAFLSPERRWLASVGRRSASEPTKTTAPGKRKENRAGWTNLKVSACQSVPSLLFPSSHSASLDQKTHRTIKSPSQEENKQLAPPIHL